MFKFHILNQEGSQMEQVSVYSEKLITMLIEFGPRVLSAVLLLIFGFWLIKMSERFMSRAMARSKIEVSLQKFFISLSGVLLKILLIIVVASMVGIETTSFVALIGAAGLAVGLALQGSLANFAGGVLILMFKPFRVGDFIEGAGNKGTVAAIQVFHTVLITPDNKRVIIPNGELSSSSITNYSAEPTRRVDMVFGIGYDDDLRKAKTLLHRIVDEDERILKEPEPTIAVSELADSSVNFVVRVWCQSQDYWAIFFDMQEKVKLAFDAEGISIPYPQRDVHLHTVSKN